MTLQEIIQKLNLTVLTTPKDFAAIHPGGGYASTCSAVSWQAPNPANYG